VRAGEAPAQSRSQWAQRARALLLHSLAAVGAEDVPAWPQALTRAAAPLGVSVLWHGSLVDAPQVAAVRVAHALEMGQPGLQGWVAGWPAGPESAALQFAAAAARLLAGREPLQILAAAVDGASEDAGALIDAESCARMAVAGFDPETEARLGNCVELLASAGDLLNMPACAVDAAGQTRYLILGLKWHAPAGD
jgi:hypothetical protein